MKKFIDFLHSFIGHSICKLYIFYFNLRDIIFRPRQKALLIVTHPDDDTLFFHTYIKEHKPYVVLCTDGYAIRRVHDFAKTMRHYGVKFRVYDLSEENTDDKKISKIANWIFKLGKFELCATHGIDGEYGHHAHQCTSRGVIDALGSKVRILVPSKQQVTEQYPLSKKDVDEKIYIYNHFYQTQDFCLEVWPQWLKNEHLVDIGEYINQE